MKPLDRVTINKENLLDEILDICKQHKEEKRALAFAFLIYDFKDAAIHKVLKDED